MVLLVQRYYYSDDALMINIHADATQHLRIDKTLQIEYFGYIGF